MTTVENVRQFASTLTTNGSLTAGKHTPVDATSGNLTVTLPSAATPGAHLSVEKRDSSRNLVTVSGTIRGSVTTVALAWQYESVTLRWDGSTWVPTEGHKTKTALDNAYGAAVNVKSFGAKGDGSTDDTAAFDAIQASRSSTGAPLAVYIPPGNYRYNGSGINAQALTIRGAGRGVTKITLGAGSSFINNPTGSTYFEVTDITFDGGYGAIRVTATINGVGGHRVIHRCEFWNYTGVAISSLMNDNPYWSVKECLFMAIGDQAGQMGIALASNADVSLIENNAFLKNQVHLKLGKCGMTAKVIGNDFIRFGGPSTSPNARTDIWLVPNSNGDGAAQIIANKFGNENIASWDHRVLIAEEDTVGANFTSRMPVLTTSSLKTGSVLLDGNNLAGASAFGNPAGFVTSTTTATRNISIVNTQLVGTFPTAMLNILFADPYANPSCLVSSTITSEVAAASGSLLPIAACNKPGYATVIDPSGIHRTNVSPAPNPGTGWNAGFVSLYAKAVSTMSAPTGNVPTRTPITDAVGGTDAATITTAALLDRYYGNLATAPIPGLPGWIEADLRLTPGASNPITVVRLSLDFNGSVKWAAAIALTATWQTIRLPFTPGDATANQVTVRTHSLSTNATGQYDMGRVRVYQAPEPVRHDLVLPTVLTATTAPAAGAAAALPATPAGYMTVFINGIARQLPYY
jgi:hypothetical protein